MKNEKDLLWFKYENLLRKTFGNRPITIDFEDLITLVEQGYQLGYEASEQDHKETSK